MIYVIPIPPEYVCLRRLEVDSSQYAWSNKPVRTYYDFEKIILDQLTTHVFTERPVVCRVEDVPAITRHRTIRMVEWGAQFTYYTAVCANILDAEIIMRAMGWRYPIRLDLSNHVSDIGWGNSDGYLSDLVEKEDYVILDGAERVILLREELHWTLCKIRHMNNIASCETAEAFYTQPENRRTRLGW